MKAQGEALGKERHNPKPCKGARRDSLDNVTMPPFQGLSAQSLANPGRCLGLPYDAPLGLMLICINK